MSPGAQQLGGIALSLKRIEPALAAGGGRRAGGDEIVAKSPPL